MARLIGLDVGGVRTGVASTDDLKLICSPLETVKTSELMAKLRALTDTHEVEGFVLGQPNLIAGTSTDSTPHIDKDVDNLKKAYPDVAIHFVDEGHTSKEASRIQVQGGMKASKRREKGSLDAIAASLILQRHLDASALGASSKPLPDFNF